MEMLEQFMQDPNMQQLLYQYLPEPMRNKETFDWMLKNPEYRAQLQSMIKAQARLQNPSSNPPQPSCQLLKFVKVYLCINRRGPETAL